MRRCNTYHHAPLTRERRMPAAARELTAEEKNELKTLASVLTLEQIADYFSISRETFVRIKDRDPEVMSIYKKGKSNAIASIAGSLLTKARGGDVTSMIFFLKTQAGWKETQKIDHSSEDGSMATKEITLNKKTIDAAIKKLNDEY